MKAKLFLICLLGLFFSSVNGQQLIQGTIKPGATASEFEVWLKPTFSNSTQYLFQIGMPIAFPANAASQPTGLTVTLDPGFVSNFGSNYTVTVNPVATATGGTEKYFNIVLIRGGAGASVAQTWATNVEFKVLKATFTYSGSPANFLAKLADYQDGGSDGLGNFYTQDGNNNYYITSNSIGNFYASSGNSIVGGTAAAGYAQLMAAVNAGTVSGSSPLCVGGTATYTTSGDVGGTWSSSNTSVASVNASTGLVTAISGGTADIIYTISGVTASKTLTVNTVPTVAPITGTTSLLAGGTTQLADVTGGGSWSSSNTSIASVNAAGLVTGASAGSATISYKVTNSCGTTTVTTAVTVTQPLIQGTIKSGAGPNDIEVWLKPNFSNSTQYLFQIGMPIAFPASASATGLTVTLDPGFVSNFGSNYTVTVNPVATATGGVEKYFNIVLVRGGAGASTAQTWTAGTEFKVLTATFVPSSAPGSLVKLADYQDGGSDGLGNFYTQDGNNNYYITSNSIGNFYATPGQSIVGGNASAAYAQTIASVGCSVPVVSAISGASAVCAGSTIQLSDATANGVWSSGNTAVATVSASGLVTGVAGGSVTISYAVTNGCGTTTVTKSITVNQPASSSFSASACSSYTLPWGGSVSTSGDYVHTYQTVGGCDSVVTAHITINTVPTVAPITGTTSISTGGTTQLSDATAGGVWSSDNTTVASVNTSGVVTAVSAGSATISYKVTNGCGTTTVTTVVTVGQSLIQGTIKSGAGSNDIEVWLKPNFSNSTQYLFQIGMPIAYPANASSQPTGLNVTLDPGFVAAFGNNYTVTVNPIATATGGTEKYLNIVLIRGGVGASSPQTWTAGTEFKVLTASFVPSSAPASLVKLADYQDGGSDGLGNFYTQDGNNNYYITPNSIGNFYAAPGQSTVGGNASMGYAQTIASIGCSAPVVNAISGVSTVCTGSAIQLSDATAGGVWSSGNTSVATVNASGLVTGAAAGSATISYAVTNACGTTTVTYAVTVHQSNSSSFTATACNSYTLPWGGSVTTSGTYTHTYVSANGCDSVVTAQVTINHSASSSFNAAACGSYNLPWGGSVTASGDYVHTYQTINGCDSVVTAHVTINTSLSSSFNASACGSYNLPWGGSVTTSGDYVHTYQAVSGCDSVVTVHVTINNATSSSFNASACGSYNLPWGGSVTASGDYVHTYQTVRGCDSVVTAHVTIKLASSSTTNVTICANLLPYVWNSNSYTAAGTYTVHLTNAVGCDSAAKLVLSVTPLVSAGTVNGTSPLAVGATTTYTSTGTTGGTWSSSNTAVATVNSSTGLVTAVSAGTTNITYTVNTGCGSPVSSFKTLTVITATGNISVNCPGSITVTTTIGCSKSVATGNPTYSGPVTALTWTMSGATLGSSVATGINYVGTKTFNIGTTTVTYTVKDASGHSATCSFTVKVIDNQNPTIVCPRDIYTTVSSGCSKSIAVPNPTYSDNCSVNRLVWIMVGATNAISPLNGINVIGTRNFNVGITEVIYVVTDGSGNFATSSFTVVVTDNINPVISCPGSITQTAASGKCDKSVGVPNPVFSDNCTVARLTWVMTGATTGSSSSYGINYVGTKTFKAGTTTITYTVRDLSGNTSSCSFTVKINGSGNCSTSMQGSGGDSHPGVAGHLLDVSTFPNPSNHYFNLRVQTSSQADVTITISDLTGRVVQRLKGAADESFQFGDQFIPGTYMVEVRQGSDRVIKKLVKY
jgi:trimeric autotransporter adhesin